MTHPAAAFCAAGLAALVLWVAAPAQTAAQTAAQTPAAANNQPLQIQADLGIEWQQNAHLYIARGNAVAIHGDSEVHADTLIAHYRDVKGSKNATRTGGSTAGNAASSTGGNLAGNTEIYRVDAEGHVTLKRGSQTVVGDRAVYDVDQAVAVVTGKGLKLTTSTDMVTARDSLEWYDQKQIAVARGDAVATRNGKTIKADILTAYMEKTAPGQTKNSAPNPRAAATRDRPAVTPASGKAPGGGVPAELEDQPDRRAGSRRGQ